MPFTDRRLRRLASAFCLISGPGLLLVGWAMFPSVDADNTVWVADIAAEPDRAATGLSLVIVGIALSLVGYIALVHLVREQHAILGDIGGGLAVVGTAAIGALMGLELAMIESIRHLGSSAETVALIESIGDSSATIPLWVAPLVSTVGLVLLGLTLIWARTAPAAYGALLALGAIAQLFGFFVVPSMVLVIVAFAAMFVAQAGIGIQLATETDEEWDHAPTYAGYGFHRNAMV